MAFTEEFLMSRTFTAIHPAAFALFVSFALCLSFTARAEKVPGIPITLIDREPPQNPFLAHSHWPMSHRNPYNQASSPYAGPTGRGEARPSFVEGNPVPITLAISGTYPNGQQVVWGVTTKDIFKLDTNGSRIDFIATQSRVQDKEDAISGAYSLIDSDGTFFVPRGPELHAYRDAQEGNPQSDIVLWKSYKLPAPPAAEETTKDMIVGINLTYDGRLILLTEAGLVVSLSRDLDDAAYLKLPIEQPISNSFAVDETGGIFVAKSDSIVRVQWNPDLRDDQRLAVNWSVPYQSSTEQFRGRLGIGTGTTPSLVGTGQQDKFIVIGDGQKLMHMVLIWRGEIPDDWEGLPGRHRRIAAEVPVTFGHEGTTHSTTEQSLTVRGYEIAAVSNLYGELPTLSRRMAKRAFGNKHLRTIYRSNYERVAPHGVEKFAWNPDTRKLESVWANSNLSIPNGIPTMSDATGLMYGIGARDAEWTLEAIDWRTGKSVFHRTLSRNFRFNSFYAATEIGPGRSILTGMYGGVMRFGNQGEGATALVTPER